MGAGKSHLTQVALVMERDEPPLLASEFRGRWVIDVEVLQGYYTDMPEISRFLGIAIGIFPRDHPPPHFHAVYGEYQITVDIETGVVHGDFPKRALRLVLEWLDLHQDELLEDWDLVWGGRPAKKIAPLE